MTSRKKNLVVLVSGGGTNMAAILNSIDLGEINGEVKAVISSNAEAYALVRAKERGIPAYVCARKDYPSGIERDCEIMRICDECKADYILLAGYLGILSPFLTEKYAYKIINIHPALLPKFGGKGFFGINVHKAVIDAGESESGATVHFVDGGTDTGLIIAQGKVKVEKGDTPEDLQKRILDNVEHKLFPEVVRALCADEIEVKNGKIITKQSYTNKIKGENNMKKRALISVSDKTGVVEFARGLTELGYEIISTGGTAKALTDAGVKNIGISDITGFPECLDGRVKTLHPAVHAGLLARRDVPEHIEQLKKLNINTIDIVAVNLYPFKQTILKEGATLEDAIENIDIGGPTMIRSAAKNYRDVCVIVDPADYGEVLNRLKDNTLTVEFKFELMYKVFQHTAVYDTMISTYMREKLGLRFPNQITFAYEKKQDMRYGENPQQNAAFYAEALPVAGSLPQAEQLQGKELSYNNINDTNGALELLHEFTETAVVACKHANPCGVGTGKTVCEAYKTAYECDPVSIFGGIVAVNRTVDGDTAREMVKIFLEIVVAPDFTDEALEIFKAKPNLRVLKLKDINAARNANAYDMKKVYGGLLIQDCDRTLFNGEDVKTVTKRKPTKEEMKQLEFAFKVVKHAKSNAIAIVKDNAAIGVGGGQTNRIWAAQQAIEHAGERVKGAVLASDAFFPFSDCVEAAAKAGITAVIQPGGSVRDQESIEACDKYGIAMIFVGQRHFKH